MSEVAFDIERNEIRPGDRVLIQADVVSCIGDDTVTVRHPLSDSAYIFAVKSCWVKKRLPEPDAPPRVAEDPL